MKLVMRTLKSKDLYHVDDNIIPKNKSELGKCEIYLMTITRGVIAQSLQPGVMFKALINIDHKV